MLKSYEHVISHEKFIKIFLWIFEQLMNKSWASHDCLVISKPWSSHVPVMSKYWPILSSSNLCITVENQLVLSTSWSSLTTNHWKKWDSWWLFLALKQFRVRFDALKKSVYKPNCESNKNLLDLMVELNFQRDRLKLKLLFLIQSDLNPVPCCLWVFREK